MAYKPWQSGLLTPCYERAPGGRFKRAYFDILQWGPTEASQKDTYVVPCGSIHEDRSYQFHTEADELGREFGYYTVTPRIIEPHAANGLRDEMDSLHYFGPL